MKQIAYLTLLSILGFNAIALANPTLIIVSGGKAPTSNNRRYYNNVKKAQELFPYGKWNRHYLIADGPSDDPEKNPNSLFLDEKNHEVRDDQGKLKIERRDPEVMRGEVYSKATKASLLASVIKIEQEYKENTDQPVVLYITDHGEAGGNVHLWNEKLSSEDLSEVLSKFNPKRKVIVMMDQCFGGNLVADLIKPNLANGSTEPTTGLKHGNYCMFSSAAKDHTANSTGQFLKRIHHYKTKKPQPLYSTTGDKTVTFKDAFQYMRTQERELFSSEPVLSSEMFLDNVYHYYESKGNHADTGVSAVSAVSSIEQCAPLEEKTILEEKAIPSVITSHEVSIANTAMKSEIQNFENQLDQVLHAMELRTGLSKELSLQEVNGRNSDLDSKLESIHEEISTVTDVIRAEYRAWFKDNYPKLAARDEQLNGGIESSQREMMKIKAKLQNKKQIEKEMLLDPDYVNKLEDSLKVASSNYDHFVTLKKELDIELNKERIDEKRVLSAKSNVFNHYLAQNLSETFKNFSNLLNARKKLKRQKDAILEFMEVAKKKAALSRVKGNPNLLTTFLKLLECESTPLPN